MPSLASLILGAIVPGITALLVLILRKPQGSLGGGKLAAVALGLAYPLGHFGVRGVPPFPPIDATDWPFFLAPLAALYSIADSRIAVRLAGSAWIVNAALLLGTTALMARPLVAHSWSGSRGYFLFGLVLAAGLGSWALWGRLALGTSTLGNWCVAAIVTSGAAIALASSGSLKLGQLGGALAAGAAGAAAAAALGRGAALAGAVPVVVVTCGALLFAGRFYSDLGTVSALLILLAPGATLLRRRWMPDSPGAAAVWQDGLVALVPAAGAVAWAIATSPALAPYAP